MTPACWRVLRWLAEPPSDDEPREIVAEGVWAWMGAERVHLSTVNRLLRLCLISDDTDEGGVLRRWSINSTGRALLANPDLEDDIGRAILAGRSFTISGGKVLAL